MTLTGASRTVDARSRGIGYQALLDTDSRAVPAQLRAEHRSEVVDAVDEVPVERYTSRAFHELEVERLWKRVWQMACHEDDLPEVGDTLVYEIAGTQVLLVRVTPSEVKGYYNACLHRGRQLRDHPGRVSELRCPFHGFAWNLDGSLKHIPAAWDFPHVEPRSPAWQLPEVRVGHWQRFVFVTMDPKAEALAEFLGPELDWHFERWPLADRYKQAHVAKLLRCNWKVAQEAFSEALHVVATHPQLLASIGDDNSQYDAWGNWSRAITPNGTPSPHLAWRPTEQEVMDSITDRRLDEEPILVVPEGGQARATFADASRDGLRRVLGDEVDRLCDAELTDSFYFTVFPNFHPWGAYNRIVYRFRPNGDDHRTSIMECLYLAPHRPGHKPDAAPIHWLGFDDDWTDAPELGMLARVFNQDSLNLARVQLGLETMRKPTVTFARYQETKIRHLHALLGRWLERP